MENLKTSDLSSPRIPLPRIGASPYGEVRLRWTGVELYHGSLPSRVQVHACGQ